MKQFRNIVHHVIWKTEMLGVEAAFATYAFASGVWFLYPRFDTFHNVNTYTYLQNFFTEPSWGWVLAFVGTVNLALSLSHSCRLAKKVQFATIIFWVFTANMMGHAKVEAWMTFTAGFQALMYVWIYLRTAQKCRVRRDVRREIAEITKAAV